MFYGPAEHGYTREFVRGAEMVSVGRDNGCAREALKETCPAEREARQWRRNDGTGIEGG